MEVRDEIRHVLRSVLQEGSLKNSSELTIQFYKDSWKTYKRFSSDEKARHLRPNTLVLSRPQTESFIEDQLVIGVFLTWNRWLDFGCRIS